MLAMWLTVIVLGVGLHGFIVPRIGDWRAQMEGWATKAVGVPVRIGRVLARSDGVVPTVELHQVQLLAADGRVALELPRIVVGVSVRSLLRRSLEQLYIENAQLHILRDAQGLWHVAGVPVPSHANGDGAGLEWLLAQPEVVLQHGSVQVQDDYLRLPAIAFNDVHALLRSGNWRHAWTVSAVPAQALPNASAAPQRLEFTGLFRPALLSAAATWERWSGQWYAQLDVAQLPQLPWLNGWPVESAQAQGAARIWGDVHRGQLVGVTADVALQQLRLGWRDSAIASLALGQVSGRFHAQKHSSAWSLEMQSLRFETEQGQPWQASSVAYRPLELPGTQQGHEVFIDRADLRIAADVAQRIPGLAWLHGPLKRYEPQGTVQDVRMRWQPSGYQLKGAFSNVAIAAEQVLGKVGVPGVSGLSGHFQLTHQGGEAALSMTEGTLAFPGVFEEPLIPVEHLAAKMRWQQSGADWSVQVSDAVFRNADLQGSLEAQWQTSQEPAHRGPGHLALKGELQRADGARVFRYLPLQVPQTARDYVRRSVRAGDAEKVRFEVEGDLRHMPFAKPDTGRFFIEAPLRNVAYDYVPDGLVANAAAWPGLRNLHGTLVFDGPSMTVRDASTDFVGVAGLQMQKVNAHIADLARPRVEIQAQGQAPLQSMLDFVRASPVSGWTGHALEAAQAQSGSELALRLDLPLAELHRSQVQGVVALKNNTLQLQPQIPALQALQGAVRFSHQGFALDSVRGQGLGGPVELFGGMPAGQHEVRIQAKGSVSAQGLQAAPWPVLQTVAAHVHGHTSYIADVVVAAGVIDVQVRSPLSGLATRLPAPLNKNSADMWPLQVSVQQWPDGRQRQQVDVAQLLRVAYEWPAPSSAQQAVRGAIHLGAQPEQVALPASGVVASVNLLDLDVDAWLDFKNIAASPIGSRMPSHFDANSAMEFLPQRITFDVQQLRWMQRDLGATQAVITHQQGRWASQVQAALLAGRVEFLPADEQYPGGRFFARLKHLSFPESEVKRLEANAAPAAQSPQTLPALDIRVDDVQIAGRHLGRMDLQAINRVEAGRREWWLERFDITTPEATWRAHGRWAAPQEAGASQTALTFTLDIGDVGLLLQRFGQPGVVAGGRGHLGGLLQWQGAPISPDRASLQGQVQLEVGKGQFLKVEPGVGKLLSVLSLQSLSRRMALDFRDVFSQGFAFDFVRGDVSVRGGVAMTHNLQMKGLNAAVLMEGQADLVKETQDLRVVVVPEINAMTASLAAAAINPVVGLGTFLAQMVLRGPLMEAATRRFKVHGSWGDPMVERVAMPPTTVAPAAAAAP